MLVTVLGAGDIAIKKAHKNICSGPVYILVGRDIINKKIIQYFKR